MWPSRRGVSAPMAQEGVSSSLARVWVPSLLLPWRLACAEAMFVVVLLLLAAVAPANKISHRVHVVAAKDCPKSARARRSDSVDMFLAAATRVDGIDHASLGAAEQRHVVGRHPVPAVNKALVGMCPGERRKVSLYWDAQPGMQYMLELRRIHAPRVVAEM